MKFAVILNFLLFITALFGVLYAIKYYRMNKHLNERLRLSIDEIYELQNEIGRMKELDELKKKLKDKQEGKNEGRNT